MDETFGGQFNDQSIVGAGAKSDQKPEGVAPVFISQILKDDETTFKMWGISFGMVTTVAIVRGIESSSTKVTYLLEDHTGRIEAHYWIEEGDSLNSPDVMVNAYARVYGALRRHSGKKSIMIFKMVSVRDINILTTHNLEVLHARYKLEKFVKKGVVDYDNPVSAMQIKQESNQFGLTGKQLAVYQAIKVESVKGDVDKYNLYRKFNHMSTQEIDSIIDSLASEGHIYATTDADHYLCTD